MDSPQQLGIGAPDNCARRRGLPSTPQHNCMVHPVRIRPLLWPVTLGYHVVLAPFVDRKHVVAIASSLWCEPAVGAHDRG
jgi:hypothetical protein